MAEWRFGKGWTDRELERRLDDLAGASTNFTDVETRGPGWHRYFSEAVIGRERAGPPVPGGAYERAWAAARAYEFSDPDIVTGHFDAHAPLLGRRMLLEIRVLGLHYLCGTVVSETKDERDQARALKGYRYDTLEGHLESGSEWFLVTKDLRSGEVWFRIAASWREGQFPNWWSHLGFKLVARRYQLAWHRLAYLRLRELVGSHRQRGLRPLPRGQKLIHTGPALDVAALWRKGNA